MALTKRQIVDRITDEIGSTLSESIEATEALLEIIKSSLESGEYVLVSGFGKFCVKEKAQRKGRACALVFRSWTTHYSSLRSFIIRVYSN